MLITRISQPTFTILTSSTLAQWLRIDADTDLTTLDLLLASATDWIEGYTGRVLCSANYTIEDRGCRIPLRLSPVNSITSVVANLQDGTTQTLTSGSDYAVDLLAIDPIVTVAPIANAVSYTVTLSAGYTQSGAVPPSIQHAAAVLVGAGYDNRTGLDPITLQTVTSLLARSRRTFL